MPGTKGSPEFVAEYNKRLPLISPDPARPAAKARARRRQRQSDPYTHRHGPGRRGRKASPGSMGRSANDHGQRDLIVLCELRTEIAEPLKLNREAIETALKRRGRHAASGEPRAQNGSATFAVGRRRTKSMGAVLNKNPCEGIKPLRAPKTQGSEFNPDAEDGYITWSEEDIAQFAPSGHWERASGWCFRALPQLAESATPSRGQPGHRQSDGSRWCARKEWQAGSSRCARRYGARRRPAWQVRRARFHHVRIWPALHPRESLSGNWFRDNAVVCPARHGARRTA